MNFKIVIPYPWVMLAVPLLSSCATMPAPRGDYVRQPESNERLAQEVGRIGVVTDAVVTIHHVRTNYVSINASVSAATNMLGAMARWFTTKGYEVVVAEGPVVGAYSIADAPSRIGDRPVGRSAVPSPIFLAPEIERESDYRDALVCVLRQAFTAITESGELPWEVFRADGNVRRCLDLIARKKCVGHLVVAFADGFVPSHGFQAEQIATTLLASALFAFQAGGGGDFQTPDFAWYVCVIDLANAEIVWTNAGVAGGNPSKKAALDQGCMRRDWADAAFHSFPEKVLHPK